MATRTKDKRHVYGEVNNEADLKRIFSLIRQDIEKARSRDELTEFYRRAGYLVTLTRLEEEVRRHGGRRPHGDRRERVHQDGSRG